MAAPCATCASCRASETGLHGCDTMVRMAIVQNSGAESRTLRTAWYRQLYVQVLIAIALGVTIGHLWPQTGEALKPLGDAFIKLVKMIIAPVVFLTLATGIAGMKELRSVGRVAGKAFRLLPVLLDAGAAGRAARCQHAPAGRGHEHRSGDAECRCRERLCAEGRTQQRRRVPDGHHPDHAGGAAGRGFPAAGAAGGGAVRHRAGAGRGTRRTGTRGARTHRAGGVSALSPS